MKKLNRSLAVINSSSVSIDEDKLDIFDTYDEPIPHWEPKVQIRPWNQVNGLYCDIETEGLDPLIHKITFIGTIDQNGKTNIYRAWQNELIAIIQFFSAIESYGLDFIAFFNGIRLTSHKNTGFDLWFIEERCKILGLKFPFWKRPTEKTFSIAQIFSKPVRYYDLWLNHGKTAVIDLYHQLLGWDFVARKLEIGDYNLKRAPVLLGLRKEDRITLTYPEMVEAMEAGNWDLIERYLHDDLIDTKLLGDTLIPALWNEKLYHPAWKFQSLTTSGNGSKWNDLIKCHYKGRERKPDPKKKVQGAITFAKIGLWKNCIKLDVESLYPHMMLLYGIYSEKDEEAVILQVLNYLLKFRIGLKEKKAKGTITQDEKHKEGTAKVKLNSGYGFLAATGLDYNDMVAASFVTAYGRATYKYIFKKIEEQLFEVVQSDTDGMIFTVPNLFQGLMNLGFNLIPGRNLINLKKPKYKSILQIVGAKMELLINSILPGNEDYRVKVKFEWSADSVYVPGNKKGKALRKNYLVFNNKKCVTIKGKYKKRDRSWLMKRFSIEFLEKAVYQGIESAYDYFVEIKKEISEGVFPVEKLWLTRKIKKSEKTLVIKGIGELEEVVTIYHGKDGVCKEGDYDPEYYLLEINKLFLEIIESIK